MKAERLQKYIASCGVTSRRKAEELILNGEVMVNNIVITELIPIIIPNIVRKDLNLLALILSIAILKFSAKFILTTLLLSTL